MKPEINNPVKRRNAPGSFKCQCPAEIHTRLLATACGIHLLEVTIPNSTLHKGHDCSSVVDQLSQKVLPEVEEKIRMLVTDVHLSHLNLKLVLEDWVNSELIPQHQKEGKLVERPSQFNRSYFPTNKDLRNAVHKAIMHSRGSCFDQVKMKRVHKLCIYSIKDVKHAICYDRMLLKCF